MRRTDSLEKTLMLAKIEGTRNRELQTMRWLEDITDLKDMKRLSTDVEVETSVLWPPDAKS